MSLSTTRHHYAAAAILIVVALIGLDVIHSQPNRDRQGTSSPEGLYKYTDRPDAGDDNGSIANDIGVEVKIFLAAVVDNNNIKWFLTERGIVSYDNKKWTLHVKNKKVGTQDLKDFALEANPHGQELWIASPKGATVASLPIDARTGATTYHTENTPILSNNVIQVAVGKSPMRWFGTDKGISAFRNDLWLKPDYLDLYPEDMFRDFPITSMAANQNGDTLYAGTNGAGVIRILRNDVDGISGASVYAKWGPILLPSDNVYSVFISSDNTQWFGTDKGIARHTGNNTLENWTVFNTNDGLIDNFVQVIAADNFGNIWAGTKNGVSVFDGSVWFPLTKDDGLPSNNVLSIAADKDGVVWIGTDNGVSSYNLGALTNYK